MFLYFTTTLRRHEMEAFSALLDLCEGNLSGLKLFQTNQVNIVSEDALALRNIRLSDVMVLAVKDRLFLVFEDN